MLPVRALTGASVLVGAVWALAAAASAANPPLPADDAYAPLKLYNGRWTLTPSGSSPRALENRCARIGLFFACEQVLDGKPLALVVFRPEAPTAKGWTYSTRALPRSGESVGRWGPLTIEGEHWVYGPGPGSGDAAPRERTLNQFDGPDHIHYETQISTDGVHWMTQSSGDEQRNP